MNNIQNTRPFTFSVLTANVGNLNLGCRDVLNKLCYKDVEERIAKNIGNLSPDIIALQEVLAPWQCKEKNNNNKKVCFDDQKVPQVRRLVGDNYSISCNTRNQFECIAVKTEIGEILGCQKGDICNAARTASEIHGCDNGFTISASTIRLINNVTFDVVNFHPQSTDASCREKMIQTALGRNNPIPSIIQEDKIMLLGDFNFDPWRDNDVSVLTWKSFFSNGWKGRKMTYHSGVAEKFPPYYTSFVLSRKRTVDFIASNFLQGTCNTLGESPNTLRLDGGRGTDHRAIFGHLNLID